MRRVLFLAYLFPPIANSGTQRPLKFAKYLSRHGWEPTVMTAAQFDDHRVDEGLLAEMPPGLSIVRVPMLNERIADAVIAAGLGTAMARRVAGAIKWRLQARFRSPDLYGLWRPTATRAALRVFREQPFDVIYATGYPWTTLLIGRDVSIATGRPLIADFRDPWAAEDLFRDGRPAGQAEVALERSVVEQASSVVTVSDTFTRRLRAAYPDMDDAKFQTIHNGFDPEDLVRPVIEPDRKFRIAFVGVWKAGYNPSPLYDVIDWLKRSRPHLLDGIEVIAAGFDSGEARRRGLSDHITEVGVLPHRDAVALMHSADVLFMTNADGARQQLAVPGKLYEYLATGRPVLALTHPDGDAGRFLKLTGGGVAIAPDDPGLLLEAVATACRTRRLDVPPLDRNALASFERVNLTRRLADLLDDAMNHALVPGDATGKRTNTPPPVADRWPGSQAAFRP